MTDLNIPVEFPDIDYGPNVNEFRELVDRIRHLTVGEVNVLELEFDGYMPGGRLGDAGWGVPRYHIARRVAPLNLPQSARLAIMNAASATVIKDLLAPREYRYLMSPWWKAITLGPTEDARPAGDFPDWYATRPPISLDELLALLEEARIARDAVHERRKMAPELRPRYLALVHAIFIDETPPRHKREPRTAR